MFEGDDESSQRDLKKDLVLFERFLDGEEIGFIDSDRVESIIDYYLINSQYQNGKKISDFGIKLFPYNSVFKLRKAQALTGLGLLSKALKIVDELEKIESFNAELFLTKATLLSQLRDSKNAIKYYRIALEQCSNEEKDDIYVDMAMEYEHNKNFNGAIKVLNEALRFNPNNEFALCELSYCYEKEEKNEEAIKEIRSFIDENPYSFSAWYHLGNAFLRIENFEKAVWAFDYSLLINDNSAPAHFNLASTYISLERFHKSIEHFQRSIDIDGEEPLAFCYMGEAYEQLEELELAKNCYKKSVELSPSFSQSWLGLGIIEDLEGKTKEGISLFKKALEYSPDNAGIHHVLGSAYEKSKEKDLADFHYKKSLEIDSTDMQCLGDYMSFLMDIDLKKCCQYITSFNEINGQDTFSWIWEVNIKWMIGKKQEALGLFSISCDTDREKALSLYDINPIFLEISEFLTLSKS